MDIFLFRSGQQFGPYSLEWLEAFLAEGAVSADDLAWMPGREGWVPLHVLLAEMRPAPVPVAEPALQLPEPVPGPPVQPMTQETPVDQAPPVRARPGIATRISWRSVAAVGTGLALLIVLILLMNVPEHASIARNGDHWLRPHDGYTFVDANDPFNWQVQWTPGRPSETRASMLAGSTPGTWDLAPGYEQPGGGGDPVWTPYKREPAYPNVAAGSKPGTWIPYPGYVFVGSATAPIVEWRTGIQLPHMTSGTKQNHWRFDEGYDFAPDSTDANPKAAWSPGERHSDYPRVYAAREEGYWHADEGYRFATSGDLTTFSPAQTAAMWHAAGEIDRATNGIRCTSNGVILAVIERARDQYAALDTTDVHPLLAQHVAAAHDTLSSTAKSMNACAVVDVAPEGVGLGAAAYCFFQSKKSWNQCMADLETFRDVVGAAGKIGDAACENVIPNFAKRRTDLAQGRYALQQSFESDYKLRLASPTVLVTCR
ncbi:MAG TPA: DUF4339 domain-containing protein [Thermoanaerobaculia bacterium]|nr:DUF4339 domain-containing protein [Thermoanaerobaculia bacterium]